jgi:hypothetical protein
LLTIKEYLKFSAALEVHGAAETCTHLILLSGFHPEMPPLLFRGEAKH